MAQEVVQLEVSHSVGEKETKRRAACDECRQKKLKCTGEQPSCLRCMRESIECAYSPQKPMGRPKKRPRDDDEVAESTRVWQRDSNGSLQQAQSSSSGLPGSADTTTFTSSGQQTEGEIDMTLFDSAFTPGGSMQPWLLPQDASAGDGYASMPPEYTIPGLTPDNPSNSPPALNLPPELQDINSSSLLQPTSRDNFEQNNTHHLFDPTLNVANPSCPPLMLPACACLANMYLALDSLQGMDPAFQFPFALHPIRAAMQTASEVLGCEQCPTRFISAIQNSQLIGTLMLSIAERFSKIITTITEEAERAETAGETKAFRLADLNNDNSHLHTGGLGCAAAFSLDLSPAEWRSMTKKVVRAEVYGPGSGSNCCPDFVGLCTQMESRQLRWHERQPIADFPKDARGEPFGPNRCLRPGESEEPLCLKALRYTRQSVDAFDWS